MNTLTRKQAIEIARDVVKFTNDNNLLEAKAEWSYEDVVEKLNGMLENFEKQAAAKKERPKKNKEENDSIKSDIIHTLEIIDENNVGVKAAKIAEELGLSTQKTSALLRQLAETGRVVKTEVNKKTTLYSLS